MDANTLNKVSFADSRQLLQQLKDVCGRVKSVFTLLAHEEKCSGLDALQATVSKIVSNMKPSITGVKFELEYAEENIGDIQDLMRPDQTTAPGAKDSNTEAPVIKEEPEWEEPSEEQQILEILPQDEPEDDDEEEMNEIETLSKEKNKNTPNKKTPKAKKTATPKVKKTKKQKQKAKKQKQSRGWENRKIKCPQCPYGSDEQWEMDIHLIAHSKDKEIKCQLCSKEFTAIATLKRHIMSHYDIKPFECRECKKRFVDQASLKTHIKMHLSSRPQRHNCETCGKEFTHLSNLVRHRRQHDDQPSIQCDQCPSSFTDQSSLDTHLAQHKGKKLFPCSHCKKQFRSKKGLQCHEQNHQKGVKDHVCNICHKYFPSAKNLKEHGVIHTNVKSFVCGGCNSAFSFKSNLKRHLKICRKDTVLKCQYCDQVFESSSSLQYHESIHTGKRLVCDKCGFTCRSNNALKKHKCDSPRAKKPKKTLAEVDDVMPLSALKSTENPVVGKRKYKTKETTVVKRKKLDSNTPEYTTGNSIKTNTAKVKKSLAKKKPLVIKFNVKKPKKRVIPQVFENTEEAISNVSQIEEPNNPETAQHVPESSLVTDDSFTSQEGDTHKRKSSTPRKITVSGNDSSYSELESFVKTEDSMDDDLDESGEVVGKVMTKIEEILNDGPNLDSEDI